MKRIWKIRGGNRWAGGRPRGVLVAVVIVCLALLAPGKRMSAQVQTGISGSVVDGTGAVVAGASVSATNDATGVVTQGTDTSSAGAFTIIGLIPGTYTVTVDAAGFKRSVKTGVSVEISKESAVFFTLAPGEVNQTVTVADNQISLNTTSPEMGTTLEPELVKTLPIEVNGGPRVVNTFVYQAPGVTNTGYLGQATYVLSGGQSSLTAPYINGVPVTVAADQYTGLTVPYEMIKEFRVNVSTFSAQYGLSQGAITYNTASGTNQLHGDAFDILRNMLFDSDGFFPSNFNSAGKPIPPINHQNDYGLTLGGPVIIPRLYNGKDRTFFLFSLDNYFENGAQTAFGTVPTPAEKTGDFSNFVDANGNQIPIYDPLTGKPFPGNIIPQSRFSPLAKSILPYIPNPNRPGIVFGQQNNEQPAIPSLTNVVDLFGFTLDHNINQKQSIHYSEAHNYSNSPGLNEAGIVPASNPLSGEQSNTNIGDTFLFNYVNALTPNLVLTIGADWVGDVGRSLDAQEGTGFAGVVNPVAFPSVNFDGQNPVTTFGPGSQGTNQSLARNQGFSAVNNWLWSRGRHTLNMGAEYRRPMGDILDCNGCASVFNFSQRTTSTPNSSDPNFDSYGSSFASFLLGQVDNGYRTNAIEVRMRATDFSSYIQDNIKMNNRLTIDAGLRWDIPVPFNEVNNNIVFANMTGPNPGAANLPGVATKYGNCAGCANATHADIHWGDFGPRFGFSYSVNNQTVIQGGYYLAYLDDGAYNFGNARIDSVYSSLLAGEFFRGSTQTNRPGYGDWDTTHMPDPPATPFSPTMANGGFLRLIDPKKAGLAPYTQQWNLSLQRQLPWQQFLTVAYIGNRMTHLTAALNQPWQLNPGDLKYGSFLGDLINTPGLSQQLQAAGLPQVPIPYPNFIHDFGAAASVEQALLPFPQYGSMDNHFDMSGVTEYNALEVQEEKRFTNGLSYLASLTMARNMSNSDYGIASITNAPVNTYDQALEWAPSSEDQKYMVKVDSTYALPIGIGQKYLHSNNLLDKIVGGWQVAGIMNYAGGLPSVLLENNNVLLGTSSSGEGINRPDFVPGVKRKTFNYNLSREYFVGQLATQPVQFTTNAFTPSCQYCLGDTKRTYASIRTPPLRIEDFDAMKYFHITDGVVLTLRVDYFNAFNRTRLQSPDPNISDSTFGMITNQSSQISNRQGQATFRIEF